MIKRTDTRKGSNQGDSLVTPAKALESLAIWELSYGGQITDLSPTRVVVETRLGNAQDETIFEGSPEEMAFLVKVAAHHAMLMADDESRSTLVNKAVEFLGTLPKEIGGLPLAISMLAPFLLGGPSTQTALLFACGITDPEVVKTMVPISTKDLVAAVQLHQETGAPLPEVVAEFQLAAT